MNGWKIKLKKAAYKEKKEGNAVTKRERGGGEKGIVCVEDKEGVTPLSLH